MPKGKPFSSQAQRGLMHAVAAGRARNADVPKAVAERLVAEDEGGKLPKRKNSSINEGLRKSIRKTQRKDT